MTGIMYEKGIEELGEGGSIDYLNDNIKVALLSSAYTPDAVTHQSLVDISEEVAGSGYTAGGRLLEDKATNGSEPTYYLASNMVWRMLSIINVRYAVVYKDTGVPATSWLIACVDLGNDYDLVGQDLIVAWNAGVIFYTSQPGIGSYEERIVEATDDGCSTSTNFFIDLVRVGKQSASTFTFLRFQNVSIPQGAEILAAKLTFRAGNSNSGTVTRCNIHCNDEDHAISPINQTDHGTKVRTGEFVAWDDIEAWVLDHDYESPDFANVVQEVIDRPGWITGNALMVLIDDDGSSNYSQRVAYDRSDNANYCTLLTVSYTTNVSGVETPIVSFYDTRIRLRARNRQVLLSTKVRNIQ